MTDANKLLSFLATNAKDPATPSLRIGEIVGSWRILSCLGGGGFGEVYRVEHVRIGIVCALKILKHDTENAKRRFEREIVFVATHGGSGVPRFYETGEYGERPYFVMELLSPKELPTNDRGIVVLVKNLCRILSALHEEGFVHRDIKPSNILYRNNGDVVLVDYGLLKEANGCELHACSNNELTQANVALGTERYAAPEQLAGNAIDCHADIHSLGVLVDTCFRGRLPWRWRRIVCRATSSLAEQRYPNCQALARAIALRFAGEITSILSIVAVAATIALSIVFASGERQQSDIAGTQNIMTNSELSVEGKNVSDAASEWLTP